MKRTHHLSLALCLLTLVTWNQNAFCAARTGENGGADPSKHKTISGLPGKLAFQTDLFAGRFGYKVPLEFSPGRHDFTPSADLVYSSANGNGLCGVGWDLDLGYIQREARHGVPVRWTNGAPVKAYDDGKGFVFSLNGQTSALVPTTNNEYRAEIQGAFLRFMLLTNNNQWQVIDKSGNIYSFGTGATNRMSNTKTGWPSNSWNGTYRWALNHVQTALGDTADYTYTNFSGAIYPLRISYNGHTSGLTNSDTVDFGLETRGDVTLSFISGYRVELNRRLAWILHKAGGQNVWSNRLTYLPSTSTTRSLLQSVSRSGSDLGTPLPPLKFAYSAQSFSFQADATWGNVNIPTGGFSQDGSPDYSWITGVNNFGQCFADLLDMDGDGLPDRVFVPKNAPWTSFQVQHNNGSGFDNPISFGALSIQNYTDSVLTGSSYNDLNWDSINGPYSKLIDINGDGYPDRITDPYESLSGATTNAYTRLLVQLNNSTNFQSSSDVNWTNVVYDVTQTGEASYSYYRAIEAVKGYGQLEMVDLNGDGLPDRIMTRQYSGGTSDNFWVQFNTGAGFTGTNIWSFDAYDEPASLGTYGHCINSTYVRLIDIKGDGLPDRVMFPIDGVTGTPQTAANVTNYVVQYNNGYGFEPAVTFGGVVGQYVSIPTGTCGAVTYNVSALIDTNDVALRDMNGDGLPDRVYRYHQCGMINFMVQLNQGTNFGTPQLFGPYSSQGRTNDVDFTAAQGSMARLIDINGDGLPDRVMVGYPVSTKNYFVAELSSGPFPDLLTVVSNGIGGSVTAAYKPSTIYDNGEVAGVRSRNLLPFPVYTVSSVTVSNGIYPGNIDSLNYSGGFWNATRREFDGFATSTETDPLNISTIHFFHQAGGRDNTAYGEYLDSTATIGKKGREFRTDIYGSDGLIYKQKLNLVDEALLAGGQHFAFVSQSVAMDYALGSSFRTTAQQFTYDTNTGNLTASIDFGEVTNVSGSSLSDIGNDTTYQIITYTNLGNTNILDHPQRKVVSSDNAGQTILRESQFDYDGSTGNLTQQRERMCDVCYITNSYSYDGYNNQYTATDPAGIPTITTYDLTQTFPLQQTVGSTLISTFKYDTRSGKLLMSTNASGLVTSNAYDAFFRLLETDVSTTQNGPPTNWLVKYDYKLNGAGSGISTNYVHQRKSDGVDTVNGHETWTYSDGLGMTLQVREEAEANGFRTSDTVYNTQGNIQFVTVPYFSTGTNFTKPTGTLLGALNGFDPIGRLASVTAAVNGIFSASGTLTNTSAASVDVNSPVGATSIAYHDGTDPWTLVITDEESKVHKYSLDAHGRTNRVVEIAGAGNYTTKYGYNLTGDLTSVTDNSQNQIQYAYNDLGQIVAMADPDMGVWQYERDFAGRLRKQIDACGQSVTFNYDTLVGRLANRLVYDYQNKFTYGITNVYDSSDDGNFTVYTGQLYKVIDNQGWEKSGYDVRGRTLKSSRFLTSNNQTYTTQFAYDDSDRLRQIVYPNNGPTITNIFDSGGNLSKVQQLGGANTVYYWAKNFSALGQLTSISFGNNVLTTNDYFPSTKRPRHTATYKSGSTNIQDLTYSYNKASDIIGIGDGVYLATNSPAITNVVYDDLHRLTSLKRPKTSQTSGFGYDSIGNITASDENGGGAYSYGSRLPHAIKSANNVNYAYDANGNMLVRGTQRLAYDPENRLQYAVTATSYAMFGYDFAGTRLWKQSSGTNTLQVWIGNYYEEKNGLVLYHVSAGERLVCTFDQTGTNVFEYYHPDHIHSTSIQTDTNGNRVLHYEYAAYGQDRWSDGSAFPASRRFTGQVKDDDTGLYYYGSRYYDPVLGRFIQPDDQIPSVFNPQSLNRYSYALGNPLRYTDPTGHSPLDYIPGYASYLELKGQQDVDANVRAHTSYGSYSEMVANARGNENRSATSGDNNMGGISASAHAAGDAADIYTTALPNLATAGMSSAPVVIGKGASSAVQGVEEGAASAIERSGFRMGLNGAEKTGPGKFTSVAESMSKRAAAYQSKITGLGNNMGYLVGGVKFDGFANGVLLDAKGPGYAKFVKNGQFKSWWSGADDLVAQAQRQLQAAKGIPIQWHFAEEAAAKATQNLFDSRGISGIELINTP